MRTPTITKWPERSSTMRRRQLPGARPARGWKSLGPGHKSAGQLSTPSVLVVVADDAGVVALAAQAPRSSVGIAATVVGAVAPPAAVEAVPVVDVIVAVEGSLHGRRLMGRGGTGRDAGGRE